MYDFIRNSDDAQNDNNNSFGADLGWGYGNHNSSRVSEASGAVNDTIETLDDEVDDELLDVLEEVANIVEGAEVSAFECEVCGLTHSHAEWKHNITNPTDTTNLRTNIPGFNVRDEFAIHGMEYNPRCHCGVNELAMMMPFFGYMSTAVFSDESRMMSVLEAGAAAVEATVRDVMGGGNPRDVAAKLSNHSIVAGDEALMFLSRVEDIQSAANNAPIPAETRQDIEQRGNVLEGRVN